MHNVSVRLLSFLLAAAVAVPLALASIASKPAPKPKPALRGIHKIEHVVVIMQENRSFDEYFGTFPGADGIPAGVCVPDPANGGCIKPYHDPADVNSGGSHTAANAQNDIHGARWTASSTRPSSV